MGDYCTMLMQAWPGFICQKLCLIDGSGAAADCNVSKREVALKASWEMPRPIPGGWASP